MTHPKKNPDIEFSRPLAIQDISEQQPLNKSIKADQEEQEALAERFDLIEMSGLTAELTLKREMAGHMVRVDGHFKVDVVQKCVVTLEPVPDSLDAKFEAFFTDIKPPTSIVDEVEMKSEIDDPEFVQDGVIDLGELVAQYIALELDPYPRKGDVHHDLTDDDLPPEQVEKKGKTHRPFEVLKDLKK